MKKFILVCFLLGSFISYSQGTGPDLTVTNDLFNCQIEVTFFQINTTTMDCGALVTTSFGLGVLSDQTISPLPGHAFVRAFVQKGGGTPACFSAMVEPAESPDPSPCNTLPIQDGEYFFQCCSSSSGGGTYVRWFGGMSSPSIEIGNS